MDIQTAKINRSVKLIKGFMALVVFMFLLQYYQTSVLDLGAFAGSVGVLSLLRGILLSPSLLTTPVKNWTVFAKPTLIWCLKCHRNQSNDHT